MWVTACRPPARCTRGPSPRSWRPDVAPPMYSTDRVEVEAPPSLVFGLARDVQRWPALLPHYLRVRVLARHADESLTAELVAVRPIAPVVGLGLPVLWRSRAWDDADALQLRFVHLGGA